MRSDSALQLNTCLCSTAFQPEQDLLSVQLVVFARNFRVIPGKFSILNPRNGREQGQVTYPEQGQSVRRRGVEFTLP